MHQKGRASEKIIIRANKVSFLNYWFDKLLHIAVTTVMMMIAMMVLYDIDNFNIDFTMKESVENHCMSN